LHLEWQQVYIQRLIDVFSTIPSDITMHFIIATHSPFIISDLPKENIIKLVKND
jgi:predicted ATP-binding protein involved in virulence